MLKIPVARYGLLMSLMLISSNEVINLVFGVWLEDSFGLKLAALGAASAVIGISEISGESLGGCLGQVGSQSSIMVGMGMMLVVSLLLPFLGGSKFAALIGSVLLLPLIRIHFCLHPAFHDRTGARSARDPAGGERGLSFAGQDDRQPGGALCVQDRLLGKFPLGGGVHPGRASGHLWKVKGHQQKTSAEHLHPPIKVY